MVPLFVNVVPVVLVPDACLAAGDAAGVRDSGVRRRYIHRIVEPRVGTRPGRFGRQDDSSGQRKHRKPTHQNEAQGLLVSANNGRIGIILREMHVLSFARL